MNTLPAELHLLLLQHLSCPQDLFNVILASKFWNEIFKRNKNSIKLQIIRNIATPEVEADFCLVVQAQHMVEVHHPPFRGDNASIRFQLECLGFLDDTLSGKQQTVVELVQYFDIDRVFVTAQLFHATVYYYAYKTLNRLNQVEGPGAPLRAVPLSYLEKQRIMRAFCRHEVYVCLLPCWIYIDTPVRGLRASQAAATFVDQFKPWEIEEVGCVDQFMQDTIGEVFENLEDYVVSMLELKQDCLLAKAGTKSLPESLSPVDTEGLYWTSQFRQAGVQTVKGSSEWKWRCQYFATRGLRRVLESVVDPHLSMILQSPDNNQFPPPMFGNMDPTKLPRTCIERDGIPESREENLGWFLAFYDKAPVVNDEGNKKLRSYGYVFWDDKRVFQYRTLRTPHVLDEADCCNRGGFPIIPRVFSRALEEKMKNVKLPPLIVTEVLETLKTLTIIEKQMLAIHVNDFVPINP